MRSCIELRLMCVVFTILFSSVNCFANVVHSHGQPLPLPLTSTSALPQHKKTSLHGHSHAQWSPREVEEPNIKASATTPIPKPSNSNIYSFFTFAWVKELMEVGNKKTLELSDLWLLEESQLMANASQRLDDQFVIEKNKQAWDPLFSHNNLLADFWYSPLSRAVLKQ